MEADYSKLNHKKTPKGWHYGSIETYEPQNPEGVTLW